MTIRRYVRRGELLLPEGIDPENSITISPLQARIGGFWRLQLRRKSGSLKYDTGWFNNIITDFGMDSYGASHADGNAAAYCCVGTGTSAPSVIDTTLVSPLAYNGAATPTNPTFISGPPAYQFQSNYWAFPLGSVIGNISEIGAGPMVSTPSLANFRTYSRQLILDSIGNPTTVSVTAADQLNTSYQVRLYLDLTDSTTSIVISGNTYGGTIRRSWVGGIGPHGVLSTSIEPPSWGSTRAMIFNGTIGTLSSGPGGAFLVAASNTYGIYTPGTFTRTASSFWDTTALGAPDLVSSINLGAPCMGFWQADLAPGFHKTSSNTLTINWSMAWARY